jgi:micrococcal nuclease
MVKMKQKIILAIGLGLLVLGIQTRLFGPQMQSKQPAVLASIIQGRPLDSDQYVVTRVVDGDTIVVTVPGSTEKVRLIGVDTPETVDPRKPVQCFGLEASNFTKSLLANKTVRLESDPSQGNKDKYGRLLRYVFLSDINVNEELIAQGYGHEYTYDTPYKYQTEFKNAERLARESKKGLWADGVCGLQNIQK